MAKEKQKYIPRVIDIPLRATLTVSGAVLISGPRACGKTTSASQVAKTIIAFDDMDKRDLYYSISKNKASDLFKGEKPILFDEWQDGYNVWGSVKNYVDREKKMGQVILTGSQNEKGERKDPAVGRIKEIKMYPMSLYESGESNGKVSLHGLFHILGDFKPCDSSISFDDIIFLICRGGWPQALSFKNKEDQLSVARNIYEETIDRDISMDGVKRNKTWMDLVAKSYAKNICQPSGYTKMREQVISQTEDQMSQKTYDSYVNVLKNLYIVEDIDSWMPFDARSKTTITKNPKRNFIDPSLAVAALRIDENYLKNDLNLLGFLFESLCIRDIKIYAESIGGEISYIRTRNGLEVDIVVHFRDDLYALVECKLWETEIEKAAKHLKIFRDAFKTGSYERLNSPSKERGPEFCAIITNSNHAYLREDGIYVIPIGCLRP